MFSGVSQDMLGRVVLSNVDNLFSLPSINILFSDIKEIDFGARTVCFV